MPTSATGNDPRQTRPGRGGQHGFTLLELLVVVTIIGLVSSLVVLSLPPSRPPVRQDAGRLAAALATAAEAGVIGGELLGVVVRADGIRLLRWRDRQWQPAGGPSAPLSDGTVLHLVRPAPPPAEGGRDMPPDRPLIRFDPVGLSTPFLLRVEGEGGVWQVSGDAAGRIALAREP